ncbi:hypothetical protein [Rhizobium halophilum]|uniref:hypothetical protein n=1 Tax=Rhizobium halophilum TaxID=2846852 RepID=UPI001EFC8494|nr:hypothetical protein [Rhizobium halophilum]MCF6370552.1 hypothetical protein [Rhizobium halophilum]
MKTGNAIGDIIEIAARMKQEAASAGERVEVEELDVPRDKGYIFDEFDGDQPNYAVKGTITTTYDANGKRLERFVGTFQGMTDEAYRQLMIDGLKHDQSTPRNRAALAAFKNGTMREVDLADLGVKSGVVRTKDFFEDGSARSCRTEFEVSGMLQFREQHTELRDGVLYEKETGKFAAIGQNGSKFIY